MIKQYLGRWLGSDSKVTPDKNNSAFEKLTKIAINTLLTL